MSVVSVRLIRGGRSGGIRLDSRRYQRQYRVVTDDANDGELTVLSAAGLPVLGESHPLDIFATCKSLEAEIESDSSEKRWIVTAEYNREPDPDDENEDNDQGNPLDKRWKVSGSSIEREIATEEDVYGNPILTSAGEPIRGVTFFWPDVSIVLEGNVASINLHQISLMSDKTNESVFFTADPGEARLTRFAFQMKRHQQVGTYFTVTYEFAVRSEGWNEEKLDQGFYELDDNGNMKLIVIEAIDENGTVVDTFTAPEPVPLNGAGKRDSSPPSGAKISVEKYVPGDFAALLGIPTSFEQVANGQ